jgi:phosphoenolpyruvate carboxylase
MYAEWPFFREVIDLIAMILSKTDYSVSSNYEKQLVTADDKPLHDVGDVIRKRLLQTRESVLSVTGCEDFYSGFQLLKLSMKVRNPYVDPLNVLQAEIMKRLRHEIAPVDSQTDPQAAEQRALLEDALIVSVNGIAQGMKNSG